MTDPSPEQAEPDYLLTADAPGERLDKFLAETLDEFSRSQIQTLIKDGLITLNGGPAKASYRLEGGEQIAVILPEPELDAVRPEAIPLDVLYEDDDLVAIHKPAGMVVHPAYGHTSGTLVNALLYRWPQVAEVGDEHRAGIVHRLDKDTSGVIVVAKTPQACESLTAQFAGRAVTKRYLALVARHPDTLTGVVDAPIGRDPRQRKQMAVVREGREAVTEFKVLGYYGDFALLECHPRTGRTHQIRVHLAFIGCPVVGDQVYGFRKQTLKMKRLFLHAAELTVQSPSTGEPLTFVAPLPVGLQNILDKLPHP